VEGLWQPFKGCVKPAGEARQGWKILTALSQVLLPADDYSYADSIAVRNELKDVCRELQLNNFTGIQGARKLPTRPRGLQRVSETAIYAVDETLRNAKPLQETQSMADSACLRVNRAQAEKLKLEGAEQVHVTQGEGTAIMPLAIDENVPAGCAWVAAGMKPVAGLGSLIGAIKVEAV
jgi:NADH-quinone oxidoreductase subunit G